MTDTMTVGFLGAPGSYSNQAAQSMFPEATLQGFPSFGPIVAAAEDGSIDAAVLPLENSISGRIPDVHRLVLGMNLFMTEERLLDIEHCLIVSSLDAANKDIETIISHPQGLLQSDKYLSSKYPDAARVARSDTATAVAEVVKDGATGIAAIGSEFAAKHYGGIVIARNIADRSDNLTRFVALKREAVISEDDNMTSMIIQVDHKPGALVNAIQIFGKHGVNITKLETYMISEKTVYPTFYLDVGCGAKSDNLVAAMEEMKTKLKYSKFLGSYKYDTKRTSQNGFLVS